MSRQKSDVEIIINPDWKLTTDLNNVILHQRISSGGQIVTRGRYAGQIAQENWQESFHSTFKAALKYLTERHIRGLETLVEITKAIDDLQGWIEKLPILERQKAFED